MRKMFAMFAAALLALSMLGVSVAAQDASPTATPEAAATPTPEATATAAPTVEVTPAASPTATPAVDGGVSDARRRAEDARRKFEEARSTGGVRADAVRRLACEHVQAQIKHLEAFVTAARARGILERGEAGEFLDEVRTRAPKLCESRTRDEARGHLRELEAKWKKAKALARARLAREHSDGIRGLEMRMRQLAHRIRVALAHIEARGVDVSPVESKLAECKVSLDAARDKAKEAKDLLGTVESPEQKESVVEQVHGLLADARGKVKEAHACYGDALRLLKEKAREAAGKPTVEPVVTPTPEPEAAPTATPTAEPTAEATPSPSPSP